MGEKYRGMILYAVDKNGKRVGSWELPPEELKLFHTPDGACDGKAVIHSGAAMKPYHGSFAFRNPPAGTGKITFHCLLKVGPANTGYFVWPVSKGPPGAFEEKVVNYGGDLQLWEQTKDIPTPTVWVKGAPGQNCVAACRKGTGGECDEKKLGAITDAASFDTELKANFACKQPLVGSCLTGSKFNKRLFPDQAADGFCDYRAADCTDKKGVVRAPTCTSRDAAVVRFCPCTGATDAVTNLDEDEWTEVLQDQNEEWAEVANDPLAAPAKQSSAVHSSSCVKFVTKEECEINGCSFEGEEGMAICSQLPSAFQPKGAKKSVVIRLLHR